MAVTSGFFSSVNGDRKYTAEQMAQVFEGFITDGVFQTVGNVFNVQWLIARTIKVDTGRAWFDNIWIKNDAVITLDVPAADVLLNRWDAVVIEVNKAISMRSAFVKIISGTAASEPVKPTMVKTEEVTQYPIAYIYCKAGSTIVKDEDITMNVGTDSCPYSGLVNQSKWIADEQAIFEAFMTEIHERISEDTIEQCIETVEGFDGRLTAVESTISQGMVTSVAGHTGAVTLTAADIGAGTFPGEVKVPASSNYTTAKVVNSVASDTAPTAGSASSYPNGTVLFVYE